MSDFRSGHRVLLEVVLSETPRSGRGRWTAVIGGKEVAVDLKDIRPFVCPGHVWNHDWDYNFDPRKCVHCGVEKIDVDGVRKAGGP